MDSVRDYINDNGMYVATGAVVVGASLCYMYKRFKSSRPRSVNNLSALIELKCSILIDLDQFLGCHNYVFFSLRLRKIANKLKK